MKLRFFIRIISVITLLCAVVFMSGCSLYIASLDKLFKAPMSDPELEKTINKKIGSSLTLIAPSFSDDEEPGYLSSTLNYADLDDDGTDEVICFYSEKSSPEKIRTLILKTVKNKWEIISDTVGHGSEIASLRVLTLSDSPKKQIVTTWKYVDNMILNISTLETASNGTAKLTDLCDNRQFDELKMVNIDKDDYPEILVINYSSASLNEDKTPFLCVLDMNEYGSIVTAGQASLPKNSKDINLNYLKDSADNPFVVFLDYLDENSICHTNIFYWDTVSSQLTGISDKTSIYKLNSSGEKYVSVYNSARLSPKKCIDINNDGTFEIPFAQTFADDSVADGGVPYIVWAQLVFSKDGSCAFSDSGGEKRVYFDDVNFLKIPAYFDENKLFVFSVNSERWEFRYGDFANREEASRSEGSSFVIVQTVDENEIEEFENSGFAVLGSSSSEAGRYLMYRITDYGTAMSIKKSEIFNIK